MSFRPLVIAALLLCVSLNALPSWVCHPELMVEGLYLRPSSCDLDFVIADERPFEMGSDGTGAFLPAGRSFSIRPNFKGGARLSLGYTVPPSCLTTRLIYTTLCTHHTRSFEPKEGGSLWPTTVHPRYSDGTPLFAPEDDSGLAGLALVKGSSDYQTLQLEVSKMIRPKPCLTLHPFTGLQLAYIENSLDTLYRGTEEPPDPNGLLYRAKARSEKSCWGVGPLLGIHLRYALLCDIGFGAHIQMGIMAGETHGEMTQQIRLNETNGNEVVNEALAICRPHRMLIFPFFEGKVGVNYLWRCGRQFCLLIEFGYDLISYINSLERFRFNDQRGTGSSTCHSFSLDGVYLQFALQL